MQWYFALTLLTSATLLFWIQPMFAKMVLPLLGGTPMVWNTCMVFYQAVLLAGYGYAHASTRFWGAPRQARIHLVGLAAPSLLVVLLVAWLVLPIRAGRGWDPPTHANPIPWLLGVMVVTVGFPLFVVSASAPMLQTWFAQTGDRAGRDPYFLYAASNLGSLGALVGYPLVIEPNLGLSEQTRWWACGYAMLVVLTCGCAVLLWRRRALGLAAASPYGASQADQSAHQRTSAAAPTLGLRLRWLALAFAPSSLLLGVTTFISTDLAAVPLLWVIPLALYLLSFVLVFSRATSLPYRAARQLKGLLDRGLGALLPGWLARLVQGPIGWLVELLNPHRLMLLLQPFVILVLLIVFYTSVYYATMAKVVLLHLVAFFLTAMVCHGELARTRPKTEHLTEFYLWMSVGGVLGGMFNALVAPLAFPTVVEYPLMVAVACMLRPTLRVPRWPMLARWLDLLLPAALFGILAGLIALNRCERAGQPGNCWIGPLNQRLEAWIPLEKVNQTLARTFHIPASTLPGTWNLEEQYAVLILGGLVAFLFQLRPVRLGLGFGAVLLVNFLWYGPGSYSVDYVEDGLRVIRKDLYGTRTFFGVVRVLMEKQIALAEGDQQGGEGQTVYHSHTLRHGTTDHGEQRFDHGWQREPISYYFRRNELADLDNSPLGEVFERLIDPQQHREVGVAGLGTGTIACYGKAGQRITFFEIDPAIQKIAENPALFTYLNDSDAQIEVKLGDARLSIGKESDGKFDMLIFDAFSSDAIPIHLLTQEAVELYLQKLKPEGILLFHISNRHLDLAPVLGNLARELGLVARRREDSAPPEQQALWRQVGRSGSDWVLLVRHPKRLGPLASEEHWETIPFDQQVRIWTDDYSNILSVLNWWRRSDQSIEEEPSEDEAAFILDEWESQ